MNHKKFIQLLNLYVDGEASPSEAREVERVIETNPACRRIYDDYRRMHEATRLLYSQFRTTSATSGARVQIASARRLQTSIAQPGHLPGRPFRRALFWTGGAVAACFALVVAFLSMPHFAPPQSEVRTADAPGVSVPVAEAAPAIAATRELASDSYAAPFATNARSDAFILQSDSAYSDPFSLGAGARAPSFNDPELTLSSVPSLDAARFAPASARPLDARVAEQNRKLQSILRGSFAPKDPAPLTPSGSSAVPVTYQP